VTRAIIVGGGIGGLTAGIALRQAGIDAVVLERAAEFKEFGTGLHIAINAMRAMRELGLAEQVKGAGTPIERMQFLDWRGRILDEWPVDQLASELGVPGVGVTRPSLHRVLVSALGDDGLRMSTEFAGFEQDTEGITARLADGREERADLLVGADGIQSSIRRALIGAGEPRYAGYTTARAIIDFDHERARPGLFRLHWGRGKVFIFYRVAEGRLYWVAATRTGPDRNGAAPRDKGALLDRYREFCEPVAAVIEATPEESIVRADAVDRPPVERWGDGRITLLGDAAHPMSPTQGQGACQAIEDGVILAKSLRERDDVVAGLRAYEERRIPRTSKFVRQSRMIGSMGRWQNPLACALRDGLQRAAGKRAFKRAAKEMAHEF
jgi:2-polyprenyl-6-methoxyphenol hydroxylase-like FAD-dependent oxidoreductase